MRDYDRTVLLERIEREGATVGARMPEAIEVDGTRQPVRSEVLELTAAGDLSDDEADRARELAIALRQARKGRLSRLRSADLDRTTGEALAEEIAGIDRALNALTQLDAPGVAEQAEQRARADQARWMSFLREALGHDEGRRR